MAIQSVELFCGSYAQCVTSAQVDDEAAPNTADYS